MEELRILKFQAEHIADTLMLAIRIFECDKKESSFDRDIIQAKGMIDNILKGEYKKHVKRF